MISKTLLLFGLFAVMALPSAWSSERPNIVFILSDDQGVNDVSCYGSEIRTPNIDSLAHEGARFDNFYVASSICTPSRFAFLTGQYPSRSQDELLGALMYLEDKKRGVRDGETTIASVLQQANYSTALIGKWHLGHGAKEFLPTRHGFDFFRGHTGGCIDFYTMCYGNDRDWYENETIVDKTGYATDLITDEAVAYLKADERKEQPFFLMLSYNAPHYGKGWDDGNQAAINIMQPPPKDLARVSYIEDPTRRKFAAKVVNLDDGIGRVLEAIDTSDLRENTLVIFVTDHGGDPKYGGSNKPLKGQKAGLYEGGIRVPCLMRWPAKIDPAKRITSMVSALDCFPTFCAMANVESSSTRSDGMNVLEVISGDQEIEDRELFFELGRHITFEGRSWFALRKGPWKYVQTDSGDEHLFDISKDPYETNDLKTLHPETFKQMKVRTLEIAESCRSGSSDLSRQTWN
jgi:arylsulfatase A-like enzyme